MNTGDWSDLILLLAGFLLSIAGAVIGAWVQRAVDRRGVRRPLNQLLNFGPDQLLFVFPHREEIPEAILPRTSTEDFLAMNNFISALLNIGWTRKVGVRDTHRISASDKKRNLVIICSPKSNDLTAQFQQRLEDQRLQVFLFRKGDDQPWHICDRDGTFHSKSWEQEAAYVKAGVDRRDLPGKTFEDYALITKVANPWNERNKVVLLAGIRGIGTWGAAECIKKEWQQIYDQLPRDRRDCDFSALLRIEYDNCDITAIDVRRVMEVRRA